MVFSASTYIGIVSDVVIRSYRNVRNPQPFKSMTEKFTCITTIELKGKGCPDLTLGAILKLPFAPVLGGCLHWPAGDGLLQLQIVGLSYGPSDDQFMMILSNPEMLKPLIGDDMIELQQFLAKFGFEDAAAKAEQVAGRLGEATGLAVNGAIRDAMGGKPGKILKATTMPVN
jgi:hypothetical protein